MKPDYKHGVYTVTGPDKVQARVFVYEGDAFDDAKDKAFAHAEHLRASGHTPVLVTVTVTETFHVATLD
jgi:hypothetical protein